MMVTKSMRQAVCIGLMTVSLFGGSVMAAPTSNDLDAEIQAQQQKLQQLNQQKASQRDQELVNRLSDLENKLDHLKDNRSAYDAQGAVESLATQINDLRSDVTALSDAQASILEALDSGESRRQRIFRQLYAGRHQQPGKQHYAVPLCAEPALQDLLSSGLFNRSGIQEGRNHQVRWRR